MGLGVKFREGFNKAVYIDKILPGTEADRLQRAGELNIGDEVVMTSATFGDEMWSCRNVGKYRLEKTITVRQGMFFKMVLESRNAKDRERAEQLSKEAEKKRKFENRLQQQLRDEVDEGKKKGGWFGLW